MLSVNHLYLAHRALFSIRVHCQTLMAANQQKNLSIFQVVYTYFCYLSRSDRYGERAHRTIIKLCYSQYHHRFITNLLMLLDQQSNRFIVRNNKHALGYLAAMMCNESSDAFISISVSPVRTPLSSTPIS